MSSGAGVPGHIPATSRGVGVHGHLPACPALNCHNPSIPEAREPDAGQTRPSRRRRPNSLTAGVCPTTIHVRSLEAHGRPSSHVRLRHCSAKASHFTSRLDGAAAAGLQTTVAGPGDPASDAQNFISLKFVSRKTGADSDFLRKRMADRDFAIRLEWWSMGLRRSHGKPYNITLHRLMDSDSVDILFYVKPENEGRPLRVRSPCSTALAAGKALPDGTREGEDDAHARDEELYLMDVEDDKLFSKLGIRAAETSVSGVAGDIKEAMDSSIYGELGKEIGESHNEPEEGLAEEQASEAQTRSLVSRPPQGGRRGGRSRAGRRTNRLGDSGYVSGGGLEEMLPPLLPPSQRGPSPLSRVRAPSAASENERPETASAELSGRARQRRASRAKKGM